MSFPLCLVVGEMISDSLTIGSSFFFHTETIPPLSVISGHGDYITEEKHRDY
jgi:hypothetical protein